MRVLAAIAMLVIVPAPATAQRDTFVDALIAFHSALAGTYGDEGREVTAQLDRMSAALDAWRKAGAAAEARLTSSAATPADFALHYIDHADVDAAIRAMAAAVETDPRRAPLQLYLGMLLSADDRHAEAAAAFRAAFDLDASEPVHAYLAAARGGAPDELRERAAGALMNAGSVRRVRFLEFALVPDETATTPVFAPDAYAAGFALLAQGRLDAALEQFRAAAARDPLVADAAANSDRLRQGVAALRERRGEEALAHLQAAAAALPMSPEAQRVLGVALQALGRIDESVRQFERAATLAPRDERVRIALGTALAEAGDLERAAAALRDTIELRPESGEARWALADVYERLGRGADALAALEQAAALPVPAGKAALWFRIADLAHRHQDYEKVVAALSERARLRPNEPAVHKDLGVAYTRVGRDADALIELLTTSLLGHEDAEMLSAIGQIHLNAGRLDAAESALRRAVALDAQFPQARYALGSTLLRLGRAAEGKEQLAEFQRLRTAALDQQRRAFEIETLIHEGDLHVREGRLQEAVAPYERAAALGGPAEIYRTLADVYGKLGRQADQQKALAAYEARRAGGR